MKKRQLINEIMGVPKAVDEWVNYFTAIVTVGVNEIIAKDSWEAAEITYDDEDYPMYSQEKVIDGRDVTKLILAIRSEEIQDFLDSTTFQEFPLFNPIIEVNLSAYPDDVFEGEGLGDRFAATHTYDANVMDVKLGKLGKRTIFSKNKFIFDVVIPFSYIETKSSELQKNLYNTLAPTIAHELTHSYQTYRQLLGGKPNIGFGRETILNVLPQQLKSKQTPSWNYFLHLVYLHLSFEVNARVTELYYKMKRSKVETNQQAMEVLKQSDSWKDYKRLVQFNAEEFISNFKAQLEGDPIVQLFRLFSPSSQEVPTLPKSNEEWFDLLIDRWDEMIQDGQRELNELGIDIPVMEKVPDSAKKNPIEFFEFFERRFQKKAEKLRRKLTRVVSLVLQEAEEKQKAS